MIKKDIIRIRKKYCIPNTFHLHAPRPENQVTSDPSNAWPYTRKIFVLVSDSPYMTYLECPWSILSCSCPTHSKLFLHSCFLYYSLSFFSNLVSNIIIQDLFHAERISRLRGQWLSILGMGEPLSVISLLSYITKKIGFSLSCPTNYEGLIGVGENWTFQ